MQLSKIAFRSYKRFEDASCNVDGRTIAFIGPNEAGKTSLLEGLEWLTDGADTPLGSTQRNRRRPPSPELHAVTASYRIDDDDITLLHALSLDVEPKIDRMSVTRFSIIRRVDGRPMVDLKTTVKRNPKPFIRAREDIISLAAALTEAYELLNGFEYPDINGGVSGAADALDDRIVGWDSERVEKLRVDRLIIIRFREWIEGFEKRSPKITKLKRRLDAVTATLESAITAAEAPEPTRAMINALFTRVPKFILFGDEDRNVDARYDLNDENLRLNPPSPLANIINVASTSMDELWSAISGGDAAVMRTLQRKINSTLLERINPMWTQSKLTVDIAINRDGILEVNIQELDSPDYTVTPIAERSDGLRTFLGLVCFLAATDLIVPPVLMIDEAERNLHYDAQADLVRVLTRELNVHKVIYTTHSPGCLPLDLGTGIRVVVRDAQDPASSTLQNNFWTETEPGFSHLLFAMGAQAAAFSTFRRAVLTEGVSEMILLPTLLRNATDGRNLDFQVAFGLSNMSAPSAIGSVALRTAFLVDGDSAGETKVKQLSKAGVPSSHIFKLPPGLAIEDLVQRTAYIKIVNELLAERGVQIPAGALEPTSLTIAKAVDEYVKDEFGLATGVGHKIVATRLASLGDELPLSAPGKQYLKKLRSGLEAALASTYELSS